MTKKSLFLLFFLQIAVANAQHITCSAANKNAVALKLVNTQPLLQPTFGTTLVAVGKTFLKTPYVAKTLEIGSTETLVVNILELDCTTFVENVLAFSMLLRQKENTFDAFTNTLEIIRYKDGVLDGYASRLHYFSEWIANNAAKGLLKDITEDIGGKEIRKEINFMSTHRNLYPFLADDSNYKKIKDSENYVNNKTICVLSVDDVEAHEHFIEPGDIIAIATAVKGLDVTHTGIATREKDGRIHLLHASTKSMQVEISKLPLASYLKKSKNTTGIMVARPL